MRAEIDQVVAAVDDYINAWHQFAEDDSLFPRARWIEPGPGTSGGQIDAVQICSSPFTAGPVLNRDVWPKIDGAVLCSATLAPFGQFDAMARDLGLSVRASTLRLESPFDHSRASIVLPRLKSSPEKTTAHTAEVTTLVRQVMTSADGGVLVIFTSRKQMKDVLAAIGNPWRDQILVQGDAPTDELVRMHVERIDAGLPSTLFGLATMSEGFNLPGRLCTRVVMAKLPFPAPDEPIIAARCEWLAARGQDAFREVMLPKVWVRLAQTAGRLMRSETDWGEVLILDSRMRTKPYGKQLLKTMRLPVQDVTAQTAGEANNRDGHSRDSNERLAGEAREARAATADATARANDRAAPAIAPAARMSPPARRHAVREPARARTSAR
jgi:ATP-dependent DNA helicase DinG